MKCLDLFSGIGGFHLGLIQAGFKFDWVGYSEIDKYAKQTYKKNFPNSEDLGDVTTIRPEDLPKDIGILSGGFPCQTFSIAGKRAGFNDTRGTLFFEIARILRYFKGIRKPIPYFILENVKGLLNHDDGRTFNTIYGVLADLDYTVECQLLNTRWFLPQNRERIYIVGHLGKRSGRKVFPIGENDSLFDKKGRANKRRTQAEYSTTVRDGISSKADGTFVIVDKKLNKKNNQDYAANLSGGGHSGGNHSDMDLIRLNQIGIIDKDVIGRKVYSPDGVYITRDSRDNSKPGISGSLRASRTLELGVPGTSIRRLTPTECERLQGFPDGWTEGQSDTQRYKQLGNAVSVPVVKAVGLSIKDNIIKEK